MGILHRQLSQRKARSTDARNICIFLPKNIGGNMPISVPVGGRTRSADPENIYIFLPKKNMHPTFTYFIRSAAGQECQAQEYGHIPGQKYGHNMPIFRSVRYDTNAFEMCKNHEHDSGISGGPGEIRAPPRAGAWPQIWSKILAKHIRIMGILWAYAERWENARPPP